MKRTLDLVAENDGGAAGPAPAAGKKRRARRGKRKSKAERLARVPASAVSSAEVTAAATTLENEEEALAELHGLLADPLSRTNAEWDRAQGLALRLDSPAAREIVVEALLWGRRVPRMAAHYAKRLRLRESEALRVLERRLPADPNDTHAPANALLAAKFLAELGEDVVSGPERLRRFLWPWQQRARWHQQPSADAEAAAGDPAVVAAKRERNAFRAATHLLLHAPTLADSESARAADKRARGDAMRRLLVSECLARGRLLYLVPAHATSGFASVDPALMERHACSADGHPTSAVVAASDGLETRRQLTERIETALRLLWPDCRVVTFGSSSTGLLLPPLLAGDDGSAQQDDLDLCVVVPSMPMVRRATAPLAVEVKEHLALYLPELSELLAVEGARVPIAVGLMVFSTNQTREEALGWNGTMSDPFYLADILLGRVGVLRSTAESIVIELCEAPAKLDAPGGAAGDEDALRLAIKSKLERVQTNLKLLRKLVPEFDGKTKPIESVNQTHRNLMLEYHWKNQVQEMGAKAQNVFLEQLGGAFPRLEMLGDVRCPPPPNTLLVAKSHKRGRVFDPFGEKQPATLNEMMDYMMAKNRKLKFFKQAETTRGGRRVIRAIRCEVSKEVTVHVSFNPPVPESGPNGESGVAASPMTPSTPTSPAFTGGRLRSTRNKHKKQQQQQLVKKKKGDMLTKAKLAAEEATKMEMEELKLRIAEAREASREQELARAAGVQVSKYMQRVSVLAFNEPAPLGAWSESQQQLFQLVTLHARNAVEYFRRQHPETSFYHLFTWLAFYDKVYQTPCSLCKKLLAKENDDAPFLLPSFRDYSSGQAFHARCLPAE